MESINTLELDASFDEPNATIASSVSSCFFHLVSTPSDSSKLQHGPSIKFHKVWCQAKVLLLPLSVAGRMLISKLIH